jgi:hypothetical protein
MPHIKIRGRAAAVITSLVTSLACLGLAACGSSSGGSSTGSTTATAAAAVPAETTAAAPSTPPPSSSTTTTPPENSAIVAKRRQVALRVASCMRSAGVKVPEPDPEGYIAVGGGLSGTPKFKAAVAKCKHFATEALGSTSSKK